MGENGGGGGGGGGAAAGLLRLDELLLSSAHDLVSSISVQCALHCRGDVTPVTVSCISEAADDACCRAAIARLARVQACPHRHLVVPLAIARCEEPLRGGDAACAPAASILTIEPMPSSSTLQSMILEQMRSPLTAVYTWKQAIEWLTQIAAALAHLHAAQPDVPHAGICPSAVYVVSSREVALGRCLASCSVMASECWPAPKRPHINDARGSRGHDAGAAQAAVSESASANAIAAAWALQSPGLGRIRLAAADEDAPSSSGPLCDHSGSDAAHTSHGADLVAHGSDPVPNARRRHFSLGSALLRSRDEIKASASIDSVDLPGVGPVTRVATFPKSRSATVPSLFDVAEASGCSRSSGESKQHGGGFFGPGGSAHLSDADSGALNARQAVRTPHRGGSGGIDASARGDSLLAAFRRFATTSTRSGGSGAEQDSDGSVDATTRVTEAHLMSEDAADASGGEPVAWAAARGGGVGAAISDGDGDEVAASDTSVYVRVVQTPSNSALSPPAAARPWGEARQGSSESSPNGGLHAHSSSGMAAKRARSGQFPGGLPSLVELPVAEAAGELEGCRGRSSPVNNLACTPHASAPLLVPARGGDWQDADGALATHPGDGAAGRLALSSSSACSWLADVAAPRAPVVSSPVTAAAAERPSMPPPPPRVTAAAATHAAGIVSALRRLLSGPLSLDLAREAMSSAVLSPAPAPPPALNRSCSVMAAPARKSRAPASDSSGGGGGGAWRTRSESDVMGLSSARLEGSGGGERKQRGAKTAMVLLEDAEAGDARAWRERVRQSCGCALPRPAPAAPVPCVLSGAVPDDIPYLAPEVLEGGEAGHAADVFAFGVLAYETLRQELLAARVAVAADNSDISDAEAMQRHADFVVQGGRPRLPTVWPADVQQLIQLCWQDSAYDRPRMAHVVTLLNTLEARSCG